MTLQFSTRGARCPSSDWGRGRVNQERYELHSFPLFPAKNTEETFNFTLTMHRETFCKAIGVD